MQVIKDFARACVRVASWTRRRTPFLQLNKSTKMSHKCFTYSIYTITWMNECSLGIIKVMRRWNKEGVVTRQNLREYRDRAAALDSLEHTYVCAELSPRFAFHPSLQSSLTLLLLYIDVLSTVVVHPPTTQTPTNAVAAPPGYGPMKVTIPPTCSRGGLLVHAPSQQMDEFLMATTTTTTNTAHAVVSHEWIQELLWNHGGGGSGRRRNKRKLRESPFAVVQKKQRVPLEQDEYFLEFLTLRHDGNVDTAQLALLVASGAGRGNVCVRVVRVRDRV